MTGAAPVIAACAAVIASNAAVLWRMRCQRRSPRLLRGSSAIARRLRLSTGQVENLHNTGQLPTFRMPGDTAPHATTAALDEWRRLWMADKPTE